MKRSFVFAFTTLSLGIAFPAVAACIDPASTQVDWQQCTLSDANLSSARLTEANLSVANLNYARSNGVNLREADLSGSKALACSLALVMALDISGSIDDAEYALQQQGLADALLAPSVRSALLSANGGAVRMMIFEWSAGAYQNVIVPWTVISSGEDIIGISRQLREHPRGMAPHSTSIGNAMIFAADKFNDVPECHRKTVDISGDGPSNRLPSPAQVRATAPFRDITVNALVIGSSEPVGNGNNRSQLSELMTYYREQVIHGPGAFAEPVEGFQNYREAMIRKLLRELEDPQYILSQALPGAWSADCNGHKAQAHGTCGSAGPTGKATSCQGRSFLASCRE